jgi:hypothetical protein
MFLHIEGMKLPKWAAVHTVTSDPKYEEWQGGKPIHVCPLGETFWPDDVKSKIADIYKAVGVPDPMKQKLVEPYAGMFGGQNKEGIPVLTHVNWNLLLDYFEWEAASVSENVKLSNKLQGKAEKKHGGAFSHYPVYQDYTDPRGFERAG